MTLVRRHVLAAALAAGTAFATWPALAPFALAQGSGSAQGADAAAISLQVEALRQAMLAADKDKLLALASDALSYGHSAGKLENKAEYADAIASKKAVFKTLEFKDQTIAVTGNTAIVRNTFVSDVETDGKVNAVKVGVLQVWQKEGATWKLYARQAFRLPS